MKITLYTLGSLKKDLLFLQEQYLKRCQFIKIIIKEFKKEKEFQEVIDSSTYLLKENGKTFSSLEFKDFLFTKSEWSFAISSHEGFSQDILKKTSLNLSLSSLTFPHDLARIIFLEQVYRSETLFKNHPYHY